MLARVAGGSQILIVLKFERLMIADKIVSFGTVIVPKRGCSRQKHMQETPQAPNITSEAVWVAL